MPDFKTLKRRRRPNDYLVLPPDFEAEAAPSRKSPIFATPRDQLGMLIKRVALAEPRTTLLLDDEDGCRFEFVQRSKTFRFPDFITVACFHEGDDASTLAAWSRSKYGISDRGVNRKRIDRWIAAIEARVGD